MTRRSMTDEAPREGAPSVIAPLETEFLDLDGDGVPDAVRTTRTVGFDTSHDGRVDIVEVTEELASGIGIDGTPRAIHVTDTVETDFRPDGSAGRVASVVYDLDPTARSIATSSTRVRNEFGKYPS